MSNPSWQAAFVEVRRQIVADSQPLSGSSKAVGSSAQDAESDSLQVVQSSAGSSEGTVVNGVRLCRSVVHSQGVSKSGVAFELVSLGLKPCSDDHSNSVDSSDEYVASSGNEILRLNAVPRPHRKSSGHDWHSKHKEDSSDMASGEEDWDWGYPKEDFGSSSKNRCWMYVVPLVLFVVLCCCVRRGCKQRAAARAAAAAAAGEVYPGLTSASSPHGGCLISKMFGSGCAKNAGCPDVESKESQKNQIQFLINATAPSPQYPASAAATLPSKNAVLQNL